MTPTPPEPPHRQASDTDHTPPDSGGLHDKLVVLATFENAAEAHLLRIELANHGISAAVSNETSAQSVGASLFGRISAVWIEVLVFESVAEKALQIKHDYLSRTSDTDIPEWVCQCGETVDAGFAQCWSCMAPYSDPDIGQPE